MNNYSCDPCVDGFCIMIRVSRVVCAVVVAPLPTGTTPVFHCFVSFLPFTGLIVTRRLTVRSLCIVIFRLLIFFPSTGLKVVAGNMSELSTIVTRDAVSPI